MWGLLLAVYVAATAWRFRGRADDPLVAWATVVQFTVLLFFFALMLFAANPFKQVTGGVPLDGRGPNPLLQNHPLVAIHPPALYAGLVGFTIDLRNGLTAEKTVYTDTQNYDTTVANLKAVESSLDWGGKLTMTISADNQSICLTETSKSGKVFAIADVAAGANAGTYFAKVTCPALTNGAAPGACFTGSW